MLHMPIPSGTDFVSASDDGTFANGRVTWNVGQLVTGESKSVRVTVMPDANLVDGTIITAEANIDPGMSTEYIVTSKAATPIHSPMPLHISYGISQTVIEPGNGVDLGSGGLVTYTLTATNTGKTDLLDVSAHILMPNGIVTFSTPVDFSCASNGCHANHTDTWNIGTLAPGQSKTVFFRTHLGLISAGEILRSMLTASGSDTGTGQIIASQDLEVDGSPLLNLNLASGPGPAIPGKPFPYTATFGNFGTQSPSGVKLHIWIPDGTVFDSASHGGIEQNGVVTWNIKSLQPGQGGQVKLWVTPDQQLADGAILTARAAIDPNVSTEETLHSIATTPVRNAEPLHIDYSVDKPAVAAGDSVKYTIKITNSGSNSLQNVTARILMPGGINSFNPPADFDCGGYGCHANETDLWNIGTLGSGKSQSVSFATTTNKNNSPGVVLRSYALATASNIGESQPPVQQDVLVGSLIAFNLPPSAAVIASPKDSTSLIIGGADGGNPLPPDTPFIVKWMPSTDPENDAITYHWQLSSSNNFSNPLLDAASSNNGKDTLYQTTYGDISKILSDNGVAVGDSIMLYDRVVTSDGVNVNMSDTLHIILTRGTLTGIEQQPGIPSVLALHDNYPNPFNPTTTIRYDLPKAGVVRLAVFDVLGRQVAELINAQQAAGFHTITFNASGLSSGVYFYRLKANNHTLIKKMLLMK